MNVPTTVKLSLLAIIGAVAALVPLFTTSTLIHDITTARQFVHARACAGAPTSPPTCLESVPATVTNAYIRHGSKGGTYYYVTVAFAGGGTADAEVDRSVYDYAPIGGPATVERWGSMNAYIDVSGYRARTQDNPVSSAEGISFAWVLGTGVFILCAAYIVVVRTRVRRAVVADFRNGPIVYTPAPTVPSLTGQLALAAWCPTVLVFFAMIGDSTTLIFFAVAILGALFAWVMANRLQSLTLDANGITYRSITGRTRAAPWSNVEGVQRFGTGRGSYRAIGVIGARPIRHGPFMFCTSANSSLLPTIDHCRMLGRSQMGMQYAQPYAHQQYGNQQYGQQQYSPQQYGQQQYGQQYGAPVYAGPHPQVPPVSNPAHAGFAPTPPPPPPPVAPPKGGDQVYGAEMKPMEFPPLFPPSQ